MDTWNVNRVSWTTFHYEHWQLHIAATCNGLCYVNSPNASFDLLIDWVDKHLPNHSIVQDDEMMKPYTIQLREYFQGLRTEFSLPVDLYGTSFHKSVWKVLLEIPYGHTYSYSQIANTIGNPNAVRAVGTAIGANPVLIVVPCHRVIGKNGSLTGYRGGMNAKAGLLQLEGIPLMSDQLVRMIETVIYD